MVQIKSMTGFGTAEAENQNWHVKAEIKSLNNKFLDLNIRLPKAFKDKEIEFGLAQYSSPYFKNVQFIVDTTKL